MQKTHVYRVAVKKRKVNYYSKEALLFTLYQCYGNLA